METVVVSHATEGDADFFDRLNGETGVAERAFAFHVQSFRVRSTQPRRLAVSALAEPGSHSPGGPFAKAPPKAMQQAVLLLDSAADFEKVVLGLRAAEEAAEMRRAVALALSRRREEARRAARRREEGTVAFASFLGRHVIRSFEGGELPLPPAQPLVLECAR